MGVTAVAGLIVRAKRRLIVVVGDVRGNWFVVIEVHCRCHRCYWRLEGKVLERRRIPEGFLANNGSQGSVEISLRMDEGCRRNQFAAGFSSNDTDRGSSSCYSRSLRHRYTQEHRPRNTNTVHDQTPNEFASRSRSHIRNSFRDNGVDHTKVTSFLPLAPRYLH